jgi:hypothetical protein
MSYTQAALAVWAELAGKTAPAAAPVKDPLRPSALSALSPPAEPDDPWPCDPSALPRSAFGDWPPRAAEIAGWPAYWRERWGQLANDLADAGAPWPTAERVAFITVVAERLVLGLLATARPGDKDPTSEPEPAAPAPASAARALELPF